MLENSPNLWQKYEPVSESILVLENSPNLWLKYEPVPRFLIDSVGSRC